MPSVQSDAYIILCLHPPYMIHLHVMHCICIICFIIHCIYFTYSKVHTSYTYCTDVMYIVHCAYTAYKCCIQVIYGSPCWLVGHYEETNKIQNIHTPQETYLTLHNMDCPSCKLAVIQIFNGAALNLLYGKCVKVGKRGKLNQIGSKL